MRIEEITIRNYRNFRNGKIEFKNSDSVVLGENGSGKTNLFRAIRLLLDNKYNVKFRKEDYSVDLKFPKAHWIIIQAKLCDVKSEDLGAFGCKLNPDDDNNAWITLFFRPVYEERVIIKNLCDLIIDGQKSEEDLEEHLDSMDFRTDYELIKTVGETPDYSNDENYNNLVGDLSTLQLPEIEDDDAKKMGNSRGAYDAIRSINVIFVPAGRNPYDEVTGTSGVIKTLMSKQANKVKKADLKTLRDNLAIVGNTIESFVEFSEIAEQVTNKYQEALGELNARQANISSLISDEVNDAIKYLGLNIDDGTTELPLGNRSLGEHSIFHLVLKMVAGENDDKSKFTMLLIEEPEVHLHTHLQRTLFIRLQGKKDMQLILSTHSNNISYATQISKMIILEQKENNVDVYYPTKNVTPENIVKTERYLDANRTPLLFAKQVLLVEGDAEAIVVPWLFYKDTKFTLDEHCISLVKVDSAFFDKIAILFHEDRIRRNCYILTDKDTDFTKDKKRSRAERLGKTRHENLTKIKNNLIYPFFAENTFEIQLMDKNIDTLKKILNEKLIYTEDSKISEITNSLDSTDDEDRYKAIMKCVNYVGKGWFAILLVDYCEKNSVKLSLPEYIENAFKEMRAEK